MSDTMQTTRLRSTSDLGARTEPFEVTPDLVAANLSFGGDQLELPDEMMSAVRRIYQDKDFVWPTTIAVTQVGAGSADRSSTTSRDDSWTRISVLGTGFDPATPVILALTNADGFAGGTVDLVDVTPNGSGFFGVDVILKSVPRKSNDSVWKAEAPLTLTARQAGSDGTVPHAAEQANVPAHALWQWVR